MKDGRVARGKSKAAASGPVEGTWTLPDGWRWERIEDVAPVNPRRSLDTLGDDDEIAFVPMAAVEAETGRVDVSMRRKARDVRQGFTRFSPSDVIFAKITPCMENGKIAVIPDIPHRIGCGSTEFHIMSPGDVLPRYLYHWISRRFFREAAEFNMTGTAGQKRVPPDFIRDAVIPVPPHPAQESIVARIDALFAEIDDGEAALARARTDLATWRKALLKAAVTGELTADWRAANPPTETGAALLARILADRRARWLADPRNKGKRYVEPAGPDLGLLPELPEGWSWTTAEILTSGARGAIVIGPFGSDLKTTDYEQNGVPLIFVRHIRANDFTGLRPTFISTEKARQLTNHLVIPGDVLITKMGDPPGDTSVYPFDFPPAVITADCIRWRPSNHLSATFLSEWVNSQPGRSWITSKTKGVAQQKITLELFRSMPIPVPPADEAAAIERELKQARQAVEHLAETESDCSMASTTLRQSILAAAFRGALLS